MGGEVGTQARAERGRGYVVHLTSIRNLASIWSGGALLAPSIIGTDIELDELGSREIKEHRARRPVDCSAGGVVADYVPFYFCARSPMLYFAHIGNPLSPFRGGQTELVHVVSHVDVIADLGLAFAITDRNATLGYAAFSDDLGQLDGLIDWTLQNQTYWHDTEAEPDRMERRMAEFLVHQRCSTESVLGLVTIDEEHQKRVSDVLDRYDHPEVMVRHEWYY